MAVTLRRAQEEEEQTNTSTFLSLRLRHCILQLLRCLFTASPADEANKQCTIYTVHTLNGKLYRCTLYRHIGQQRNSSTHSWLDECVQLHAPTALSPSKQPHTKVRGACSVPQLHWLFWRREILLVQPGSRTPDARAQSMVTTPTGLSRT